MLIRQSDLIVTNSDLEDLTTLLLKRADVQFMSHETNESRSSLLPLTSLVRKKAQRFPVCYLAPLGEPEIFFQALSDVKVDVDVERSQLIQLWRSYRTDDQIQAGPFRYTTRYFEEGEFHEKPPEFVKWAEQVARLLRTLPYNKGLGAYVGEDAARKIASGELKVVQ
jgi:hypothetical protein